MRFEGRQITVLGGPGDDGEALDKGAKLLGIASRRCTNGEICQGGDPVLLNFQFTNHPETIFLIFRLKTSMLYTLQKMNETEVKQNFADLCASYQQAAVVQLVRQTQTALKQGTYIA